MNNASLHEVKRLNTIPIHVDNIISVMRKHDEIIEQLGPSGIKAVAFNVVYDGMGNRLDILEHYMWNTNEFNNIVRAHGKTAIVFKRGYNIDQWMASRGGKPTKNTKHALIPKWLVISKKGINKTKLQMSQIYFYDHLSVMLSNKVSFDKYMDNSILERATYVEKFKQHLIPEILTQLRAGTLWI